VIGYTVQQKEFWAKKLGVRSVIGDRGVLFDKKSEFNYKAIKNMDCYILRKTNLYEVMAKYPEISKHLKYVVLQKYRQNVRQPIKSHKEETESGI